MAQQLQPTAYTMSLAKSLTIDEMRALHRQALTEAEAKKTELKLVLASRYRELVGSSDEVLDMQCDAKVLDELITSIPHLVEELVECVRNNDEMKENGVETNSIVNSTVADSFQLADAPRLIHSHLDVNDVHGAASTLIHIFSLMAKYTRRYPLVNSLAGVRDGATFIPSQNASLMTQIKMVYLHLQSIPLRTLQISKNILLHLSPNCSTTARALSALHMLNVQKISEAQSANKLMDLYFDSKAKLIHTLLDRLSPKSQVGSSNPTRSKKVLTYYTEEATNAAEETISEILLILQFDVILYPYQIFIQRSYAKEDHTVNVLKSLPQFDREQLRLKVSNFLAAHLPLIRSKVKTILVGIAGTTASRLGQIRQSLYDKTDGVECIENLSSNICAWDDAIQIIDVKIVMRSLEGLTTNAPTASSNSSMTSQQRHFSLWGTLFSNTFSSLVHSILSSSFSSVHLQVVASLRSSLANAPPFREILPHEAYRNTLRIATDLDKALKKVSDDAHELLVHAEEREESERRLKQSLYVQTCEIMGRLLNELRRMLNKSSTNDFDRGVNGYDATKELILGRLCFLLKFRLTSLPILLNPNSSPAVIASKSGGKVGMITILELQSAFDIADIDDDGLISYEESMEAMEGAFSGTHFHGAEMVRDTMLLSPGSDGGDVKGRGVSLALSLPELALLSARGLKHASTGPESALGTVQGMLDDIVETCFTKWASIALAPSLNQYMSKFKQFIGTASTVSEVEWKRLHITNLISDEDLLQQEIGDALCDSQKDSSDATKMIKEVGSVSNFVLAYFMSITTVLNQSISPSDLMQPFPSVSYASAMGIESPSTDYTLVKVLRSSLVRESLSSLTQSIYNALLTRQDDDESFDHLMLSQFGASSLTQMLLDHTFVRACYFERNRYDFGGDKLVVACNDDDEGELVSIVHKSRSSLNDFVNRITKILEEKVELNVRDCLTIIEIRHHTAFKSCDIFFMSLFGNKNLSSDSTVGEKLESFSSLQISSDSSLFQPPLASSRRFMLLPIQAEQSVKELQLIKNLEKERSDKAEAERAKTASSAAASAVSSSFGFFSSMLNKKK